MVVLPTGWSWDVESLGPWDLVASRSSATQVPRHERDAVALFGQLLRGDPRSTEAWKNDGNLKDEVSLLLGRSSMLEAYTCV